MPWAKPRELSLLDFVHPLLDSTSLLAARRPSLLSQSTKTTRYARCPIALFIQDFTVTALDPGDEKVVDQSRLNLTVTPAASAAYD